MPNCLIADMDAYRAALAAGFGFTRALCGRVPPPDELVASAALVSCPSCTAIIVQSMREQQEQQEQQDPESGDGDSPVVASPETAEVVESDPVDTASDGGADEGDGVTKMLEMVQGHVAGMVGDGGMLSDEIIQCWVEGDELIEIGILSAEDREFLIKLNGLSGMLGILDLSRRLLSVVHRVREAAAKQGTELGVALSDIKAIDETVVRVDDALSEASGEE